MPPAPLPILPCCLLVLSLVVPCPPPPLLAGKDLPLHLRDGAEDLGTTTVLRLESSQESFTFVRVASEVCVCGGGGRIRGGWGGGRGGIRGGGGQVCECVGGWVAGCPHVYRRPSFTTDLEDASV